MLGVSGDPVAHTGSPAMHNAAVAGTGLDYVYAAFHVAPAALPEALAGMRALEFAGLNVTVPHKQAVMHHLDEISVEATAIGAVNTILCREGWLSGYNTDAFGIIQSLSTDGDMLSLPSQDEVTEILLLNRTVEKAEALAGDLDGQGKVQVASLAETSGLAEAGLLINSTSIGMHPHEDDSPLADPSCLHDRMLVADIVYNPLETVLMRQAATVGARSINGLGMLAWQGARSFEIWTGVQPPVAEMVAAALARFGEANT